MVIDLTHVREAVMEVLTKEVLLVLTNQDVATSASGRARISFISNSDLILNTMLQLIDHIALSSKHIPTNDNY